MTDPDAKDRIEFLEDHLRKNLDKVTADSVSDHACYSYRHANRLFKSQKGESIKSYVNKVRLQTSAEYLKYSSRSIADIAFTVGYESTAALSKAFKKQYGMSPSAFRKTSKSEIANNHQVSKKYSVHRFDRWEIIAYKVTISPSSTEAEYEAQTLVAYEKMNVGAVPWMLLWDEDPDLSLLTENRYFLGVSAGEAEGKPVGAKSIDIHGRYAIFDATVFEGYNYEIWHDIAFYLLEIDGKEMRDATYIEWFDADLRQSEGFSDPVKIGIAIR